MTPRRVLLSTDAVGGVWVYALELGRALAARDVAVELAVLGPAPAAAQRAAAAEAGVRLHKTGLALDWMADSPAALGAISDGLAALARELYVDVVQLHTPALVGHAAWSAPVMAVVHSCLGTWWEAVHPGQPAPADFVRGDGGSGAGLARGGRRGGAEPGAG